MTGSNLSRALYIVCCLVVLSFLVYHSPWSTHRTYEDEGVANHLETVRQDTHRWIRDYKHQRRIGKAAIISLVRNEELEGILQSMRQLEYRWNKKYHYPWMFFSETPFNDEFKNRTKLATMADTSYHLIPANHWYPSNISTERFYDSLDYLGLAGVGKGSLLSYRSMCRWNSGFFYRHPALQEIEYYWRVEPDVHFLCDIPYDPFRMLKENGLVYAWNMNILDDSRSFASLWKRTRHFMQAHPEYRHPESDLAWLIDEDEAYTYNSCQFFSNFEIGSLSLFRSPQYQSYFNWLDSEDQQNGFWYERFGDAPVHTLGVAMFAAKNHTWFARDIGYQHDIARHCPPIEARIGACDCEATSLDENFYKLVPMESPQRKPADTCIRQWLGGDWLAKKAGWSQEMSIAFGGNGYDGYEKENTRALAQAL